MKVLLLSLITKHLLNRLWHCQPVSYCEWDYCVIKAMCSRGYKNCKKGTEGQSLPPTKRCRLSGWRNKDYLPLEADLLTNLPCSTEYAVFKLLDVHRAAGKGWKCGLLSILLCFSHPSSVRCRHRHMHLMRHVFGMLYSLLLQANAQLITIRHRSITSLKFFCSPVESQVISSYTEMQYRRSPASCLNLKLQPLPVRVQAHQDAKHAHCW